MGESQSLEAIILKRWDYGEKDQIVSFLSKEKGRLQGIAKGAKASLKRFGPALDLFCWVKIQVKERKNSSLVFIEQAQLLSNFPKIRSDYQAILLASGFLETSHRVYKEGQNDERAFRVLYRSLLHLEEASPCNKIFWSFLLESLQVMGLAPQMEQCIKCGSKEKTALRFFDLLGGGMLCEACYYPSQSFLELSSELQKCLENPAFLFETLKEKEEKVLNEVLLHHFRNHLHWDADWSRFLLVS